MLKYTFMWAEENYNYYELESILLNYGIRSQKRWGQGINNGFVFGKDFHAEFYLPEQELSQEAEQWYTFFLNNKRFNLFLQQIATSSEEVNAEIKKLLRIKLATLSAEQLWEIYDHYGATLGKLFNCYIVTQPHRVAKLEQELLLFLQQRKVPDIPKYFSALAASSKKFTFSKKGNALFQGSFAELVGKENSPLDKTLFSKKMYSEKTIPQQEKRKIITTLHAPKQMENIAIILSTLTEQRLKMRFVWMPALYYSELFLMELKRRYNITKEELRAYDKSEIKNLIVQGKKINLHLITQRKKGFLKLLKEGTIKTYEGEKAVQMRASLVKKEPERTEITGTIACKGKAIGKVIVLSYRQSSDHSAKIKSMEQGDILVTEMTRPNIIVACEKAGAIITDEGGILCHAAIVSRELKIPCVIGTRTATTLLHDGDYVEVNAITKGSVRKLSLSEYLAAQQKQ